MWSTAPLQRSIADALDKGQPTKELTQKGHVCGVVVVQDFDGVAVEDGDEGAGEVSARVKSNGEKKEDETCE